MYHCKRANCVSFKKGKLCITQKGQDHVSLKKGYSCITEKEQVLLYHSKMASHVSLKKAKLEDRMFDVCVKIALLYLYYAMLNEVSRNNNFKSFDYHQCFSTSVFI